MNQSKEEKLNKKNNLKQTNEIAVSVKNVSKTFKIPHKKIDSMRSAFVNSLRRKTYEEFNALNNISFDVMKGEFFGIIGHNGAGKSTLLKTLAGVYQPSSGEIKIDGLVSPFLELGIGFNPELSGRDNIYLNATVLGLTKKQIDEKFDDIVKFSELEKFIDQQLKNYSSGMNSRLAFSVSIHANRDILLMDEVLAVGDSNFQSKCLEEFNKYRDMGRTVIIVTHDISIVERYCDRAMFLRNGKIEKIGKTNEVGNEYIHQNMSDEEERKGLENKNRGKEELLEKEKKKQENKVAEITKVEFLNKNKKVKNIFLSGEEMVIRVYFKFNQEVIEPLIGIAIADDSGNVIYRTNNEKRQFKIKSIKKRQAGSIDFLFTKLDLINGKYKLNVAIAQNAGNVIAQHIDQYYFTVNRGMIRDGGIVNLNARVFLTLNR